MTHTLIDWSDKQIDDEDLDNARLIAAAPNLLKALKTAVTVWENAEKEKPLGKSKLAFPPVWILDARAAIKAATLPGVVAPEGEIGRAALQEQADSPTERKAER